MKKHLLLLLVAAMVAQVYGALPEHPDSAFASKCNLYYTFRTLANEWSAGNNPAALHFCGHGQISRIQTGYNIHRENIRWAQAPGETGTYFLETEGVKSIGRFVFNGSIEYLNSRYNDLLFNNTMDFDNRNLYTIGDTVPGPQKQEGFRMSGGFSMPLGGRLLAGFSARYENSVSGKMKDPRNLNKIASLELIPGLVYRWDDFFVGISGGPVWRNNEASISVMENAKHNLFQFLGLGYFEAIWNIYSHSMRYDKEGYQAALQLHIKKPGWSTFHTLGYTSTSETLKEGTSYRLLDGITDIGSIDYKGNTTFRGDRIWHRIGTKFKSEKITGTEVEQHSVTINDGYVSWDSIVTDRWVDNKHIVTDFSGEIKYDFFRLGQKRPFRYRLWALAGASFYESNHYPVESYGYYEAFTLHGQLGYQAFFSLGNLNVDPEMGLGMRSSLSEALEYRTAEKFFAALPEADFRYISSDYYSGNLALRLSGNLRIKYFREWFTDMETTGMYFPEIPASDNFNLFFRFSAGVVF